MLRDLLSDPLPIITRTVVPNAVVPKKMPPATAFARAFLAGHPRPHPTA